MSDLNVGQAQDRLAFLVEAGMLLASSIDFEVTLRNVARLAVPRLADWCAVYRVEPDGDVTELIAEHTDPSRQELLARLRKEYPPDSENPTAHRKVVVTGQPEHYPEITPELIRMTARDETHAALLGELSLLSLVSVPLVVEERIWGAISIATDESSGRRLGEGDLSLAVEIAARAGMTIENSLLLREVAEKRRLFEITLASIGDAVIACDCDGTITFINGAAEHLTGCDSELACGGPASRVVTIMSSGASQPIEDLVARVIVEREEVELPPDAVVVARNGERAPVSGGLSPIVDEERGTIAGVVIVLHDVSAIRESELALRESRTRFRLVSDSITSHAIITLTPEGAIDSWNTGAEEIFGYTKDDAVGLNVRVLFTPEDQVLGVSEKEMREAGERGYANDDRWMMRASGERFFANGVTTPITDERGWLRGYVKVLQDYTDRKLMQEEVERARMRAEEASHAKSHFLATLSHELRTPLTPVLTAVQMLRGRAARRGSEGAARDDRA